MNGTGTRHRDGLGQRAWRAVGRPVWHAALRASEVVGLRDTQEHLAHTLKGALRRAWQRYALRQTDEQIAATSWAEQLGGGDAFSAERYRLAIPEVQRHFQANLVRGLPYEYWWEYCLGEFLKDRLPAPHLLSIGCGTGELERTLAALGAFTECDACDISPGAIAIAERAAREAGITSVRYTVSDANTCDFPPETYDAVWFHNSLHHVEALEHVCEAVACTLKLDGYVFIHEYVGPSRFAFPPAQKRAVRQAFALIPPRYRRSFDPDSAGTLRRRIAFPNPMEVRATDPSESVRSAEILDVLPRYFDIVARNDGGGTLLQTLLSNIAGNFRTDDPGSIAVLNMLFAIEDILLEIGDLRSDFALVVARPKTKRRAKRRQDRVRQDGQPGHGEAARETLLMLDPVARRHV